MSFPDIFSYMLLCFLVVVFTKIVFKLWGPSVYNHYDKEGEVASIAHTCLFCNIVIKHKDIVYEDTQVSVFHDLYPSAQHHILVIPKRHIKNLMALRGSDLELLEHMKNIGEKTAEELGFPSSLVMGFHKSLFSSIMHLHMHEIGLPYNNNLFAKGIVYNKITFSSIDEVIHHYKKKQI